MAKQETKQILTQAFFSLYKEKPINKISIRDVSEKAGFHRSTFYEYYKDIYDLLEQEEEDIYKLQNELILSPVDKGTLTIGDKEFLVPLKELFRLKGERIAVLIGVNGDAAFRSVLQERIKAAIIPEIRKYPTEHPEYIAEFLSSGLLSTFEMAYRNKADIDEVMMHVYPFISKIFKVRETND